MSVLLSDYIGEHERAEGLRAEVERLTAERDNWEADALLRAQNEAYWRERAEKAERDLKRLLVGSGEGA